MSSRKKLFTLVYLFLFFSSNSQTIPKEGSVTQSLFVLLQAPQAQQENVFRISGSHDSDEQSFKKNLITEKHSGNTFLYRLPAFGRNYTWQTTTNNEVKKPGVAPLHHFKVTDINNGDTIRKYRVRVLKNKYPKSDSLFFFLDCAKAMYDLNGQPVWFLPDIAPDVLPGGVVTDLRKSPLNTITFVAGNNCYEVDYNGNVLWKTKDQVQGAPQARYHHEFTRLANGNYMALSTSAVRRVARPETRAESGVQNAGSRDYIMVDFGNITEYDTNGNVVWEWNSSDYFTDDDLFKIKTRSGVYNPRTHLNAFYFDQKNKVIYAGFRDISRIVKIKYPEKTILASYNGKDMNGDRAFFTKQHTITLNSKNELLVFSNNYGFNPNAPLGEFMPDEKTEDSITTLVMLREPQEPGDKLAKVWEFYCKIDPLAPSGASRGGNVTELADGNLFVCMGASNRILIVSREKEILYNAVLDQWDSSAGEWQPFPQYRANPISLTDIDQLLRATAKE